MKPPVLALRQVRLADGPRMLFDGVDLALEPRCRACLVGRNGAGKTTLLRILAGEVEADEGERTLAPGLRIAWVPQEPVIGGPTVRDHVVAAGAAPHEADAALQTFGLDPGKSSEGLSGGEVRRAALAAAFARDADVLLLDEPTNHLDIPAIATLESEIAASRAAVLLVSHDRAFLERVSDRCFWLEGRRMRRLDRGFSHFEAWAEGIAAAEAEDARRLQKRLEQEEHWMQRGVTARRARNEGRRRALLELRAARAERLRDVRGQMSLEAVAAEGSGQRVAEVRRISKAWGGRTVIRDFSTRIQKGDRVAIVGPNGAGKTTLVRMLVGQLEPDSGSVKLGTGLEVAYLDQSRAELKPDMTMRDVLAPLGGDQILVGGKPWHVAAYAKSFLFTEAQLRQPVRSLSGGERNRLLLARVLAAPSNLLVLDEPTNDLDMDTLDLLEDAISEYAGTLLLVSHDRDFIDRLATSTIALNGRGDIVETPGGWKDFEAQNPGFLGPPARAAAGPREAAPAAGPSPVAARPGKLSYRDQRRLEAAEALVASLPEQIRDLELRLSDSGLYRRDPGAFERLTAELEAARSRLETAETEWLELEELKASLASGG
ncbi:ABC-F family ATP-binding cassette domain-containing protein [Phenylobacterium sp.]|uniref:ABC-F family ATP-binding cassette domain-containing protein n=2 Tax=Phenylobacterium sp. TaxID=1871053 RepID=UPI0025F0C84B|nr:ABC-F family ATP-binding cassette domain-containing protein [Phenylobacterium sp.]MCA3720610.1 ABC-F family ATP-binding cassette domain-containing protein [Phenylobacterium sp.]